MSFSFFEALRKYRNACDECEPFRFEEYVHFVESLTPEEYPQVFPLHVMRVCEILCDCTVMFGDRATALEPQPFGCKVPDYSRQLAVVRVLLDYHDAQALVTTTVGKHPLDVIAHACVWLFHTVAQKPRDAERPLQKKLSPALARYARFLLEEFHPSEGVLDFLQNSVPLRSLALPWHCRQPHPQPQAPEAMEIDIESKTPPSPSLSLSLSLSPSPKVADAVRGYPPCVQRAYQNMLHNTIQPWDQSSFFWRLFPGQAESEALLRDIPDDSRREDERMIIIVDKERCRNTGKKRYAPGCQFLQKGGFCCVKDIEDLPVATATLQQLNREARERFQQRLQAGELQSACALLCGAKADATDNSGFSPFRAVAHERAKRCSSLRRQSARK
jgi:hypothetical protein